jgi:VanZ family protein
VSASQKNAGECLAGIRSRIENPLNLATSSQLRLRLLIPSIALIVATTMIPVAFRHPSASYIDYTFRSADFINNLGLYVPLGIALARLSLTQAGLFGFSLATCAELLQLGYVDRTPSPLDVVSNTCGALIGYAAAVFFIRATGYSLQSLNIPRSITAAVAIPIALLGALVLTRQKPISDFSNWNPAFDLAIGNELSGDRPWKGTVSQMAIYPFAMGPSSINGLFRAAANPAVVNAPSAAPIFELNSPADFATRQGSPLLSRQAELGLYDRLVKANKLTILAWIRTNNLEQNGPARIVTYSQDSLNRNFTLGQIQNTLTFRLRTPASGANGTSPALYSGPVLARNRTAFVAAIYDGRVSTLYVDGRRIAQVDLGAKTPRLPGRILRHLPGSLPVREIELSVSEILLSALFALGLFAVTGTPRRRSVRIFVGVLAGVAIGGTIWIFGISERDLGIRVLLECVAAALAVAASVEQRAAEEPAVAPVAVSANEITG